MSDYIKREDALKSIDTHDKFIKEEIRTLAEEYYEYKGGVDYAYETIKHDVPAVDAVEVVRCKDCMYSRPVMDGDMIECRLHTNDYCEPVLTYRELDWFCANGEKEEAEK